MNWGVGHLRDLVGDRDNDEVGKLQMRSLVLVDNVKVCVFTAFWFCQGDILPYYTVES